APAGRGAPGPLRHPVNPQPCSSRAMLGWPSKVPAIRQSRPWVGSTHSIPAPPVRNRALDHVDVVADRPQVHHVRGQPRETVVVTADLARLVAVDAAGEGDFAVLLEQRRVVEAGAAGDEAAA